MYERTVEVDALVIDFAREVQADDPAAPSASASAG
jgi:hypothetical protein